MLKSSKTRILGLLVIAGMLGSLIACGPANKKNNSDTGNYLGKSDGGGGNDQKPRSTDDQVTKTINDLKNKFFPDNDQVATELWDNAVITGGFALQQDIKNIKTPVLKDLLTKMTAPAKIGLTADRWDFAYLADLKNTRFEIRTDRSCQDANEGEKDASTKFQLQASICFSVSRLRLIPPLDLRSRVAALLMHELAHHFGADEETAILLQNYYYDEILSRRAYLRRASSVTYLEFGEGIEKLMSSIKSEDQKKTCELYQKNNISADNGWLNDIEASNGEISGKQKGYYKELGKQIDKELTQPYWNAMSSYCKGTTLDSKEELSKADLIQELQQIMEKYQNLKPSVLDLLPTAY